MQVQSTSSDSTNLIRTIICPQCKQRINFKLAHKDLKELKQGQLVNFSLMHAHDHTLVVSVDCRGEIRRERVSKIQNIKSYDGPSEPENIQENLSDEVQKDVIDHKIITDLIVEKSDDLQSALVAFLNSK